MTGYLPPGCTQTECDQAQPGYYDEPPPEQWFVCDACDGEGEIAFGYWGYEPGCGRGHVMDDARPCGKCGGAGGWLDEAEGDVVAP